MEVIEMRLHQDQSEFERGSIAMDASENCWYNGSGQARRQSRNHGGIGSQLRAQTTWHQGKRGQLKHKASNQPSELPRYASSQHLYNMPPNRTQAGVGEARDSQKLTHASSNPQMAYSYGQSASAASAAHPQGLSRGPMQAHTSHSVFPRANSSSLGLHPSSFYMTPLRSSILNSKKPVTHQYSSEQRPSRHHPDAAQARLAVDGTLESRAKASHQKLDGSGGLDAPLSLHIRPLPAGRTGGGIII